MSWIIFEPDGRGDVHVVPDHDDAPHVLETTCDCGPVEQPQPHIWMHRDQLDRLMEAYR